MRFNTNKYDYYIVIKFFIAEDIIDYFNCSLFNSKRGWYNYNPINEYFKKYNIKNKSLFLNCTLDEIEQKNHPTMYYIPKTLRLNDFDAINAIKYAFKSHVINKIKNQSHKDLRYYFNNPWQFNLYRILKNQSHLVDFIYVDSEYLLNYDKYNMIEDYERQYNLVCNDLTYDITKLKYKVYAFNKL